MDDDELEAQPDLRPGHLELAGGSEEEHNAGHVFLYVPDLNSPTGWSAHQVPERPRERPATRQVGFRR